MVVYTIEKVWNQVWSHKDIKVYSHVGYVYFFRREDTLWVNQKSVYSVNKNERDLGKLYSSKCERLYNKASSQQKTTINTKEWKAFIYKYQRSQDFNY